MSNNTPKATGPGYARPQRLTVQAAREIVEKTIGDEGGFSAKVSPAFPAKWPPPEAGRTVVYFVYTSAPLPTGMDRRRVSSPYLRVELPVDAGELKPDVQKLAPHELAEEAMSASDSMESLDQAQTALFETVGVPRSDAAEQIRRPYLAWVHDHSALAAELKKSLPGFFAWLEKK